MRIAANMRIVTKRTSAAVLAALTVATTLIGCSSTGESTGGMSANGGSGGGTSARGRAAGQLPIRASDLASALDLVPDMADGYAMYTDWSMLGHQDRNGADTASFAGELLAGDDQLQRDLGSTAVTGRVLRFKLTAGQPRDFPKLVLYNDLGVDICP
jgi:hypothetical protein